MKFVVLPELRGRWRWELRNRDEVLAHSAMSFGSAQMAVVSINEFRLKATRSPVLDAKGDWIEESSGDP